MKMKFLEDLVCFYVIDCYMSFAAIQRAERVFQRRRSSSKLEKQPANADLLSSGEPAPPNNRLAN